MPGESELGLACYAALAEPGAPAWENLDEATRARYEAAGEAAGEMFMKQEGFVFDPLSYQWLRNQRDVAAIAPRTTGA